MKLLTNLLCPGGARGALQVIYFHQVLPEPDPMRPGDPTAQAFEELLGALKSWFNVIGLTEALDHMARGTLPPAALAVSFDDGYADNVEVALPILQRHGLTATFFVATGYLGDGVMFNDLVIEGLRAAADDVIDLSFLGIGSLPIRTEVERCQAAQSVIRVLKYLPSEERIEKAERVAEACGLSSPPRLMTDADGVRRLDHAGMEIGAHTHLHPILNRMTPAEAESDISRGRDELAAILGHAPRLFAYPNGRLGKDYSAEHVAIVERLGFDAAFTTNPGICRRGDPRWQLSRLAPWDRTPARFAMRLVQARWGLL
jgi:peptidoglycan/xylan/chitin deacetylase (PgdA/CDA1 family)